MKNTIANLILVVGLVAVTQLDGAAQTRSAKKAPCPDAVTQLEINRCAGEHFKESDKQLNKVYKRIMADLKPGDRTNLIEAQRAWLKYRSANCWANRLFHGGSLAPTVEAFCLQDITDERTKELIRIYETTEEGN